MVDPFPLIGGFSNKVFLKNKVPQKKKKKIKQVQTPACYATGKAATTC